MIEVTKTILEFVFFGGVILSAILLLFEVLFPQIRRIVINFIKLYLEAKELLRNPELAKRKNQQQKAA